MTGPLDRLAAALRSSYRLERELGQGGMATVYLAEDMSPEQAMGERTLDARADVYALGCVLYGMLVGEPPFTGPTARAIVARVLTGVVEPPAVRRPTVPPNVDGAVLTALQKLPADRFESAKAFAEAESGKVRRDRVILVTNFLEELKGKLAGPK